MICTAYQILFGQSNQEHCEGQGMWHTGKSEEVRTGFWWGKLMERRNLEDLGVDGRIILNKYSINRMNLSGSLCRGVAGICE